jgi:indole-3-glycerol phosphate synthase
LEATIKRKSVQVESTLKELGLEALEERLQSAVRMPAAPAHRVATLIADATTQGRCVLVFELVRPSPAATSAEMQQLAKRFVALGADALAIPMDAEDTPSGAVDLWTVCQAVKVPVMAKDWIIHPLQVCGRADRLTVRATHAFAQRAQR